MDASLHRFMAKRGLDLVRRLLKEHSQSDFNTKRHAGAITRVLKLARVPRSIFFIVLGTAKILGTGAYFEIGTHCLYYNFRGAVPKKNGTGT